MSWSSTSDIGTHAPIRDGARDLLRIDDDLRLIRIADVAQRRRHGDIMAQIVGDLDRHAAAGPVPAGHRRAR